MTVLSSLTAISPVDGRYRRHVEPLSNYASEFALMRYRVRVEIEWLLHLGKTSEFSPLDEFSVTRSEELSSIWKGFTLEDAAEIRDREHSLNHDVKAVEYFVRDRLAKAGLADAVEFVHFACTSEDINNLSYALMLNECRREVVLPVADQVIRNLVDFARPHLGTPMASRTHGQPASPTTVGKELSVFVDRLFAARNRYANEPVLAKMNGAVGNFNAHCQAVPQVDWQRISRDFVEALGLKLNAMTTQIEPHDFMARHFHALTEFNLVLLDLCRDLWGYIALGYFRQRTKPGEVGSSTMPHKVNPIDFENAEGNIGIANALLEHLAAKLVVSRWQRDLSDSTALRNIGTAFAHIVIACKSVLRGLDKLEIDPVALDHDLNGSWEVLTEAIQTVLRAHGATDPYATIKERVQGKKLDQSSYRNLVKELDLPEEQRERLMQLTPKSYIGLASELAKQALENVSEWFDNRKG